MSNARLGPRYFAYLLRCADGTYYAGYTVDPLLRLAAHGRGRASKYTRGRGPFLLVAVWRCPTPGAALRVERLLKSMTHEGKTRLALGAPLARALLPVEDRGVRRLRIRTRRTGAMRA
jgi:putative endonuclease